MTTILFRLAIVPLALLMAVSGSRADEASKGAFVDSFARLDRDRWYISDGWTNGAHQGCTWKERQVAVADGTLSLALSPAEPEDEAKTDFVCGEVQTHRAFGHGLYEARVRAARGSGVIFGFFTYTGPVHDDPHDEVDIEILGRATGGFQANYFVDGKGEHAQRIKLGVRSDEDFVDVAFEWLDGKIRWYVDGELVHEVTSGPLPTHDQRLHLSLWNGTETSADWLGPFKADTVPVTAEVDWIGFTPAGERCAFPQSVSCRSDWSGGTKATN